MGQGTMIIAEACRELYMISQTWSLDYKAIDYVLSIAHCTQLGRVPASRMT